MLIGENIVSSSSTNFKVKGDKSRVAGKNALSVASLQTVST